MEYRQLQVLDTDLYIGLTPGSWTRTIQRETLALMAGLRKGLDQYIQADPVFLTTHEPHTPLADAPALAVQMAQAARVAGVGPMAAVAGAFAREVGLFLRSFSREIIVENGGDLYLEGKTQKTIGVYAGSSPFTDRLSIVVEPERLPLGVCTSSGTVGHSFSYGKADAAVILSPDPLLSDAVATATANRVQGEKDLQEAVDFAASLPGITGALVIAGDKLAAWGDIKLGGLRPSHSPL